MEMFLQKQFVYESRLVLKAIEELEQFLLFTVIYELLQWINRRHFYFFNYCFYF
jgi:hypothetical protein